MIVDIVYDGKRRAPLRSSASIPVARTTRAVAPLLHALNYCGTP
jgi:hypothetical protein